MKASVVIPIYNAAPYLEHCLTSVLNQTYSDFEVLCVDDESTDESWDILQRVAQTDSRIKPMQQKNGGGGAARNTALDVAQGDYLFFLDADDWYQPTMLETMLAALEAQGADICVCRSSAYNDENGDTWALEHGITLVEYNHVYSADELWGRAFRYCVGWPWDKAFKRSFIEEQGLRFQELRTTNDAFFVYISLSLAERICFIEDDLVMHRVNNRNSLENTRNKSWENALMAMEAVGAKLRERQLPEEAERDLLNWYAHFGLWNFHTLQDDARDLFLDRFLELLGDQAKNREEGYFFDPQDDMQMRLLYAERAALLKSALYYYGVAQDKQAVLAHKEADIAYYQERIENLDAEIVRLWDVEVANRNEYIAKLETWVDDLKKSIEEEVKIKEDLARERDEISEAFDAVVNSKSFKLGRAITSGPRALRDAGKHGE